MKISEILNEGTWSSPDTSDVRYLVYSKLGEWLDNIDQFYKKWDPEAVRIVQQVVDQDPYRI